MSTTDDRQTVSMTPEERWEELMADLEAHPPSPPDVQLTLFNSLFLPHE